MADIPGDSTTPATISVGGTKTDTLEVAGDRDWFRINLTAGQEIRIDLSGFGATPVEDTYLRIRDSAGNIIYENDDIILGSVRDSSLAFEVPATGTYYIEVGSWDDAYTGGYQLSVSQYVLPPVWDYNQVAEQLISGYWAGESHRFDVSQGDTLTVNITGLTAAGQNLAREALELWSDIIGVDFVEVTTGGQITFDDNEEGAFAQAVWSAGITSSAHVNISADWLADYGTGLNTYSFQTYIHEIGHALGLGHAGNYNETASYPYDVLYRNDAWPTSVMSYFSQTENTYFASEGFDENFIVTPMIADILAMSMLYGLSTTTRAGDTTYGGEWHTNMGALTIFDSGGIDTIDVSSMGGDQSINLNPGTFSGVMGELGNVSIALGVIIENARTGSGADTLIGNNAGNELDSGAGNDTLFGAAGDDWLIPGWGNNHVDGGSGSDTVDYLSPGSAAVEVDLSAGVAHNTGSAGTDTLISIENVRGTHENDTITGSGAANRLEGEGGNDVISGGGGDDTIFGDARDQGTIGGADTLNGGAGHDELHGGPGNDTLDGGDGNDKLDGAAGEDILIGGAGDDTYYIYDTVDRAFEASDSGGTDQVISAVSFGLWAHVDNLTLIGTASVNGYGNSAANSIYGNAAANLIDGGAGADILAGGAGDDTYYVETAGDVVFEASASDGTDQVFSAISFGLWAHVDNLTLTGAGAINGYGNAGANTIYGNAAANIIDGGAGADILAGGSGNDVYYVETAGDVVFEASDTGGTDQVYSAISFGLWANVDNLTLTGAGAINGYGNAGANTIYGNAAANIIDGGAGADILAGGAGDDVYYVETAGDVVFEATPSGGTDRVYSAISFGLWANVENLTLIGTASIDGYGNASNNTIYGTIGANVLDGGAGVDIMSGGAGDDTYFVDSAGDVVFEASASGGTDRVFSSISFALWTNLENLTLTGSGAIEGYGNAGDNVIYGNIGANLLDGGAGADILAGGAGDDTYIVDNSGDVVFEAGATGGTDQVFSSVSFGLWAHVDNLTLTGGAAVNGFGNGSNNVITGNAAANIIAGAAGSDVLSGGAGSDTFLFNSALSSSTNVDSITDFSVADDTIALDAAIFVAAGPLGTLAASAFHAGTAAADAGDRIIYDSATGNIYYDADGNGTGQQVLFANVGAGTALTNADFLIG